MVAEDVVNFGTALNRGLPASEDGKHEAVVAAMSINGIRSGMFL